MNTPARQNADRLTLRTAPPRSKRETWAWGGAVALAIIVQAWPGQSTSTCALVAMIGFIALSVMLHTQNAPLWIMRIAFQTRGCSVVREVELERVADGPDYRGRGGVAVFYRGRRARLLEAGWDHAHAARRDRAFDVLWLLVEVEGAERELVMLPVAESVDVEARLAELRDYAAAGGAHDVLIAERPWGLWSTRDYLPYVRNGALETNMWGVTTREAKHWSSLSWGVVERAMFARISTARRLRLWVGELSVNPVWMVATVAGPISWVIVADAMDLPIHATAPPGLWLAMDAAIVLSTTVVLALLVGLARGASSRARRRWIDGALADWDLLRRDWAEVNAMNQAELDGRRAATRWRRGPRRTKPVA